MAACLLGRTRALLLLGQGLQLPQSLAQQVLGATQHKDGMLMHDINLHEALQLPKACFIHSTPWIWELLDISFQNLPG